MTESQTELKRLVSTPLYQRHLERRNFELYTLVWCQTDVEKIDETIIFKLRQAINYLLTFQSVIECQKYLETSLNNDERIILIVSNNSAKILLTELHELEQIVTIFIFPTNTNDNETKTLIKNFNKVRKDER